MAILGARRRRRFEIGIFSQGKIIPDATVDGEHRQSVPLESVPENIPAQDIDGPVLFAGLAPVPFGHVILNSLGRLWALEHLPSETKLLYVLLNKQSTGAPHLRPVLDLLGIENEVVFLNSARTCSRVFTAADLFSEGTKGHVAPDYLTWLQKRLPPKGQ